jgi:hypothetical protein
MENHVKRDNFDTARHRIKNIVIIIFFLDTLRQGRPTCGPEIFFCGLNWIQNSMKNR